MHNSWISCSESTVICSSTLCTAVRIMYGFVSQLCSWRWILNLIVLGFLDENFMLFIHLQSRQIMDQFPFFLWIFLSFFLTFYFYKNSEKVHFTTGYKLLVELDLDSKEWFLHVSFYNSTFWGRSSFTEIQEDLPTKGIILLLFTAKFQNSSHIYCTTFAIVF